jgi:DnaJ-class molecular chaperone
VKATANVCQNCDGRGVIVCQNCEGTGIQPRFLERYSPDDFMD